MLTVEKTAQSIRVGVYLSAFIPLLVSGWFIFPYISGKGFAFRILTELLLVLWVYLMVIDRRFRPRITPLTTSVFVLMALYTLAAALGVNPFQSFWSNLERMHGVVDMLHLGAFFLITASVFRTPQHWKKLFIFFAIGGALVTLMGYGELIYMLAASSTPQRIIATIGNASFLAGYLLFNLLILSWLCLDARGKVARFCIGALLVLESALIFLTGTRGAFLALGVGLLIFALGSLWNAWKNKGGGKRYAAVLLGAAAVCVLLFSYREPLANLPLVGRHFNFSLEEYKESPRALIWKLSLRAAQERPFLGWGPENFIYAYNQYYDPRLSNEEIFFDRAHNLFLDWLIDAGLFGLLAYLTVLVLAARAAWSRWRASTRGILFFSFLGAYIVHTFFVFDTGVSLILLFLILAYLASHAMSAQMPPETERRDKRAAQETNERRVRYYPVLPAAAVVFLIGTFFINLKPMYAAYFGMQSLRAAERRDDAAAARFLQKSLASPGLADRDIRFSASVIAHNLIQGGALQRDSAFVETVTSALKTALQKNPRDLMSRIQLSYILAKQGRFEEMIAFIEEGLRMFPRKQQLIFLWVEYRIAVGDFENAFVGAQEAYRLDQQNSLAVQYVLLTSILSRRTDYTEQILEKENNPNLRHLIPNINAYAVIGAYDQVLAGWLKYAAAFPSEPQYRRNVAFAYLKLNEGQKAIEALTEAIALDPSFKEKGAGFIRAIQNDTVIAEKILEK